jgi:hypothetical protein
MATKDHRLHARGLIEGLESRVHVGPPIRETEILLAREFLRQSEFSPSSEYFNRLGQIQTRLEPRHAENPPPPSKRNYGGEAGGCWMQLQAAYDHLILSTCYEGDFRCQQGKVKISHRFNQAGRIDFVELKFLRSMQPCLNGELRKLLMVKDFLHIRKDWHATEAFVLPVLPQELVFLYQDIFRCPRAEVLAWLVNIGHRIAQDLVKDLDQRPPDAGESQPRVNGEQRCLTAVRTDEVAMPILEQAVALEAAVELSGPKTAVVRYVSR